MKTLDKKTLFWDVGSLNTNENANFIISRILNFGDIEDFKWANKFYGPEKIKETVLKSRALNSKSLFFWLQYFNIKKQNVQPSRQ